MVQALTALQPDLILVEGPPDLDAILHWVADQRMEPPVAALCYDETAPQQATFYPFATYSPEWQAIQFAHQHRIPVRMMDLPLAQMWALAEQPVATPQASKNPLDYLAELAGYDNTDRWWEHQFESVGATDESAAGHFKAVLLAVTALRENDIQSPLDAENAFREAWMADIIRQAQREMFQNIAIVCGAWHAPALVDVQSSEKAHRQLLKQLPKTKTKVATTWIPWTNDRLSQRSGYGAGIHSPGWYEQLWAHPEDVSGQYWLSRAARIFREKGMDISTAHVMEASRLAHALAALREQPRAQLNDLDEAIRAAMCMGESEPLRWIHDEMIVGRRIGHVPEGLPRVPLQADFDKGKKRLRIPDSTPAQPLQLDLRQPLHLEKSIFLHRIVLLDLSWCEPETVSSKGTFKEAWQLDWQPELEVRLIERAIWGNTVEMAAQAMLTDRVQKARRLDELSRLLALAIPAALLSTLDLMLDRMDDMAALSNDVPEMMLAIFPLAQITRYGNVRRTDQERVKILLDGLMQRIAVGLPATCYALNEEADREMSARIRQLHGSLHLLPDDTLQAVWLDALLMVAQTNDQSSPVSAGTALRLLFDRDKISKEYTALHFSRELSPGNPPMKAAFWLEGFLSGSAAVLLYDELLWAMLYDWVKNLPDEAFEHLLPALRRTFSKFSPPERQRIGSKAKLQTEQPEAVLEMAETINYDAELAEQPMPLLLKMLGIRQE